MNDHDRNLEQEIQTAFAGRAYPGDDHIARRKEETWLKFRGKDWREIVSLGRELDLRSDISSLTFEGFVYYLPAFLTLSLDLEGPLDLDEFVAHHLWSFPEEIAPRLKPAEKRAVVHVLEFLAREYEKRNYVSNNARLALDHYWAYFTDQELGISTDDIQK